jgi:hypothetical protein
MDSGIAIPSSRASRRFTTGSYFDTCSIGNSDCAPFRITISIYFVLRAVQETKGRALEHA